ncbi:conserved hypothetical protein [Streptomyces misionensis JCM 4497]
MPSLVRVGGGPDSGLRGTGLSGPRDTDLPLPGAPNRGRKFRAPPDGRGIASPVISPRVGGGSVVSPFRCLSSRARQASSRPVRLGVRRQAGPGGVRAHRGADGIDDVPRRRAGRPDRSGPGADPAGQLPGLDPFPDRVAGRADRAGGGVRRGGHGGRRPEGRPGRCPGRRVLRGADHAVLPLAPACAERWAAGRTGQVVGGVEGGRRRPGHGFGRRRGGLLRTGPGLHAGRPDLPAGPGRGVVPEDPGGRCAGPPQRHRGLPPPAVPRRVRRARPALREHHAAHHQPGGCVGPVHAGPDARVRRGRARRGAGLLGRGVHGHGGGDPQAAHGRPAPPPPRQRPGGPGARPPEPRSALLDRRRHLRPGRHRQRRLQPPAHPRHLVGRSGRGPAPRLGRLQLDPERVHLPQLHDGLLRPRPPHPGPAGGRLGRLPARGVPPPVDTGARSRLGAGDRLSPAGGTAAARVFRLDQAGSGSGARCVQMQGGGGSRRDGGAPARAKPSVGESATDDNAADARAGPREPGLIQTRGPSGCPGSPRPRACPGTAGPGGTAPLRRRRRRPRSARPRPPG